MGIWRYADAFEPLIDAPFRVTLGEGGTPLEPSPQLAAQLGLQALWLKREDRNPTGSHKDRGMAFQVSAAVAAAAVAGRPLRLVALSSSGNAAIAAAAYGRAAGVGVVAFVAPGTDPDKVARIRAGGAAVVVSPNALTLCEAWCAARLVPNLRPSTDPAAVEGFLTLGWEILADLRAQAVPTAFAPEALFTFVSSGASFVGIGRAFARRAVVSGTAGDGAAGATGSGTGSATGSGTESGPGIGQGNGTGDGEWPTPALHAVQGAGGLVAAPFDPRAAADIDGRSAALASAADPGRVGALGARKTRRLGEVQRLIRATGGGGWWITDAEADAADALLRGHGIAAALEASAAVAAVRRAVAEAGIRRAIVIVTGAHRGSEAVDPPLPARPPVVASTALADARTLEDVDRTVRRDLGTSPAEGDAR